MIKNSKKYVSILYVLLSSTYCLDVYAGNELNNSDPNYELIGDSSNTSVNFGGNVGGSWAEIQGIHNNPGGSILIKDMNIETGNNSIESGSTGQTWGIYNEGTINFEGKSDGSNYLNAGSNQSKDRGSTGIKNMNIMNIKNMNVLVGNNDGTKNSESYSILNISGTMSIEGVRNGKNKIDASDNKAQKESVGIYTEGTLNIKNMDINVLNGKSADSYVAGLISHGNGNFNIKSDGTKSNLITIKNLSSNSYAYGINVSDGTMNIDNMNINIEKIKTTSSNSVFGLLNQKNLNIRNSNNDGSLVIKDIIGAQYAYGLYNAAGAITRISDMDIKIEDIHASSGAHGILSYGQTIIKGGKNRKNLIVNNVDHMGIYATGSGSLVDIEKMNVVSSNDSLFAISGGAKVKLSDTVVSADDSIVFRINGTGNKIDILNNSYISAKNNILMGVVSGNVVDMNVNDSKMFGKIITNSGGTSNVSLDNNSYWEIISNSNLSKLNNKNSTVDIRVGGKGMLKVGNYVGSNGSLVMSGHLGGDDSLTDKLIIDGGSATGTTKIDYYNLSSSVGDAVVDGIKIVEAQNGATINNGAFQLEGGVIDTGAYEYELHQGDVSGVDNQSMYLRSNGKITDNAKTVANNPSLMIGISKAGMNSLMKRMGEIRNNSNGDRSGVWARSYVKNMEIDDMIKTDATFYGVEGGYDSIIDTNLPGRVYFGGMVGYIGIDNIKSKGSKGSDGKVPSIGTYATWISPDGWFVDGVFRSFWEDVDIKNRSANNKIIKYSVHRQLSALSVEVGKRINYDLEDATMIIEPKVEMGYSYSKAKKFRTNFGDRVKYGETQSILGKATLMVGYEKVLENKSIIEPYVQISAINEFDGETDINYSGAKYKSDFGGFGFEVGGGLNAQITEKTSVYSDLMYEKGSTIKAISGNLGVRYTW